MTTLAARTALGVLTGAIALVAMLRLVAGAFTGGMSGFALVVTLVAMVPWVAYVTWRARRSRFTPRTALAVLGLDVLGLALVWVLVFGPVLALALSFAAFVLIWVGDRPRRRSGTRGAVRARRGAAASRTPTRAPTSRREADVSARGTGRPSGPTSRPLLRHAQAGLEPRGRARRRRGGPAFSRTAGRTSGP